MSQLPDLLRDGRAARVMLLSITAAFLVTLPIRAAEAQIPPEDPCLVDPLSCVPPEDPCLVDPLSCVPPPPEDPCLVDPLSCVPPEIDECLLDPLSCLTPDPEDPCVADPLSCLPPEIDECLLDPLSCLPPDPEDPCLEDPLSCLPPPPVDPCVQDPSSCTPPPPAETCLDEPETCLRQNPEEEENETIAAPLERTDPPQGSSRDRSPGGGNERETKPTTEGPTAATSRPAELVPATPTSTGFLDRVGRGVLDAVERFAFPLALAACVAVFLMIQDRVDRRDPKLAFAPIDSRDDLVAFG